MVVGAECVSILMDGLSLWPTHTKRVSLTANGCWFITGQRRKPKEKASKGG